MMSPLLVLALAVVCLGQNPLTRPLAPTQRPNAPTQRPNAGRNEANTKIFGLLFPNFGVTPSTAPTTAVPCSPGTCSTAGNSLGNLVLGAGLGVGATLLGQAVLGSKPDPCGRRRRRQAESKIFGLFGGGNNVNCGFGSQSGGFSNSNNIAVCACTNLSKIDQFGNEEAQCRRPDHTGRAWCYTTINSNCVDAQRSNRYPRNPWSYVACSVSARNQNSG